MVMGVDVTDFACFKQGIMAPAPASTDSDVLDRRLAALMREAQSGDKRAYAQLLNDCEPVIRRAARKVGLVGDRVEDAVQETLLTLHNARQTYDPSRSFVAWLGVIAQRRAIDVLRRTGRSDRREVHAPIVYEHHADPAADAARGWEDTGRAKDLKAAIASLSASQREAVEHLALREQSLAEAAAETGKTTGALKVNLHRALKALRGRLGGHEDNV
jgi:RNA polymerase sigma-70 factor (ECF subfamily)